jgi:hypothetical protein
MSSSDCPYKFKINLKEFLDDTDEDVGNDENEYRELEYPPQVLTPSPKTPVEKNPSFFESDFLPSFPCHHPYLREYKFEYSGPLEFFQMFKLLVFKKGVEIEAVKSTKCIEIESSDPLIAITDMNNILREILSLVPTELGVKAVCDNWHLVTEDQLRVEMRREHTYVHIQSDGDQFVDFSINFALIFGKLLSSYIPHNRGYIKFETMEPQELFKQRITFSFCPMFGWTDGNAIRRAAGDLYNRTISEKIRQFLDFYFSTTFNYILLKAIELKEK